jgi:hypothetical protein
MDVPVSTPLPNPTEFALEYVAKVPYTMFALYLYYTWTGLDSTNKFTAWIYVSQNRSIL